MQSVPYRSVFQRPPGRSGIETLQVPSEPGGGDRALSRDRSRFVPSKKGDAPRNRLLMGCGFKCSKPGI